jgi:hypothetical protein
LEFVGNIKKIIAGGSGYLSNERETKGRTDVMNHKDAQLPSYFSF